MPTFAELNAEYAEEWGRAAVGDDLRRFPRILAAAERFFSKHGFGQLEYVTRGGGSIILRDMENPLLIFRITPAYDARAVIPQILQPLSVKTIDNTVKIEVLPNITSQLSDEDFVPLLGKYRKEVKASGYELDNDDPQYDVGVFTYDDPIRPGQRKTVIMGADASLIQNAKGPPTCTADYPTLEMQWKEQCKMAEADPRLQKLLGGMPKQLPTTRVISSPAAGIAP